MRQLAIALALGLCALSASPAVEAAPAAPISKIQARALPTEAVKRRVLAQVADMLVEGPRPARGRRPSRPLNDLWFSTRPVATPVKGVCRSDTVIVEFQSDLPDARDGDADTPVRASGLSANSYFYVAPKGERVRCERLDPSDPGFVHADDAYAAENGDALLRLVATGAAAPPPAFSYACDKGLDCAATMNSLKLRDFSTIENCTRRDDRAAGKSCTEFWSDSLLVTVIHSDQADTRQILSVSVSVMVTVADYRAD